MTIYNLDILLSLFETSLLFHVQLCYFLTCIQISQKAGKVVWYFHLFQNFPQFVVIHTVKGFGIVNKTVQFNCSVVSDSLQPHGLKHARPPCKADVFLELSCFFSDPKDQYLLDPWTIRRSHQSILKEISPEYALEGLMLKLKL